MGMKLGSVGVVVLALGCGSSKSTGNPGAGGAAGGGGERCEVTLNGSVEPLFEQPASRIRVSAGLEFTVVDGAVLDGARPEIHTEAGRSGACRLLTYDSPSFCDPGCENPELCVHGACERFPEAMSAGTLFVELGRAHTVEVRTTDLGRYYWGTEEYGYEAVTSVGVRAPGDEAPGFELSACLSPPPRPTSDWNRLMEQRAPGEDVELAWSNPVPTARVYLRMTTCIGTHGGISPVEIECEGLDLGKLTLPGVYLDALYEDGWGHGECGGNDVIRYHADQDGSGEQAVQLRADSVASFWFQPRRGAL
ncbi:MAG: hypothetical protein K0R38_7893 [Polyangiaceae bacterium]|jgi:hypothetical protein|nr:hypothetical protein [Polyangiaceae bacterium]